MDEAIAKRYNTFGMMKSLFRLALLDSKESFDCKQISFGGLGEVLAVLMEWTAGASGIPMTRIFGVPLRQNQDNIKKAFRALTAQVTRGEITAFQMLDQIGARAVGYCQEAIEAGIQPKNADATVAAKGSATPLIRHGDLKGALTHVVED